MNSLTEELRCSASDKYASSYSLKRKKISVEMSTWKKVRAPSTAIKTHFPHTSEMQESRDGGNKY